jgi:hypothetical protein
MKKLKQAPIEQLKRRKCRLKNHKTLETEQLSKGKYRQRDHKTSKEGARKRKNHK